MYNMKQDSGTDGLYDVKNIYNSPIFNTLDSRIFKPYTIYCQITHRMFMYSYAKLIYIFDTENRKYYFTKDYNRSRTTATHRNRYLGFKLDAKTLEEMIRKGQAEMI